MQCVKMPSYWAYSLTAKRVYRFIQDRIGSLPYKCLGQYLGEKQRRCLVDIVWLGQVIKELLFNHCPQLNGAPADEAMPISAGPDATPMDA